MDFDESIYTLDDLCIDNLKILQRKDRFRFGIDSVLLSDFAARSIKARSRVMDLCSGSGAVSLLLRAKCRPRDLCCAEIDRLSCETFAMSLTYNHLDGQIKIYNTDVKDLSKRLNDSFDAVCVNPPYMAKGEGILSPDKARQISRSEQHTSLSEILLTAARLLKDRGNFYMVHKAHRLQYILSALSQARLACKTVQFVQSYKDKPAGLVLLRAVKRGGDFLDVLPPLVVYEQPGVYTKQLLAIYGVNKTR